MVKVEIWHDSRYPDYGLSVREEKNSAESSLVDITAEELAEYKRVEALYDDLQDKLKAWSFRKTEAKAG